MAVFDESEQNANQERREIESTKCASESLMKKIVDGSYLLRQERHEGRNEAEAKVNAGVQRILGSSLLRIITAVHDRLLNINSGTRVLSYECMFWSIIIKKNVRRIVPC